jgi:hypothetical protein
LSIEPNLLVSRENGKLGTLRRHCPGAFKFLQIGDGRCLTQQQLQPSPVLDRFQRPLHSDGNPLKARFQDLQYAIPSVLYLPFRYTFLAGLPDGIDKAVLSVLWQLPHVILGLVQSSRDGRWRN